MISCCFNEEGICLQSGIDHIAILGSVSMVTKIADPLSASGKPRNKAKIQIKISVSDFLALDKFSQEHYSGIIMCAMVSEITSIAIVYSTVYSGADQRKHQSSASLAFVPGIHRWPVNSPHKLPVTRNLFPFDDVFMITRYHEINHHFCPTYWNVKVATTQLILV